VLGDTGDRLAQFAKPVLALDQLPQNFALPFPGQHAQRAVKMRHQPGLARLVSGNIAVFGNSLLFHTTPQKPSYLCFSSYSRILCVESLYGAGMALLPRGLNIIGSTPMSLAAASAPPRWKSAGLWLVRGLLALAFAGAGGAKLYGVPMLVEEFQHIGLGQWFRYVTGAL
jgi:hypothetical protein